MHLLSIISIMLKHFARIVLDILHTHPLHQGRGAGTELVKWGTDLADQQGLQCYLESSPAAYSLAKQCDFEDITDIEIDLSKYHEGYESYKHIVMIRPPKISPRVPPKDIATDNIAYAVLDQREEGAKLPGYGFHDGHSALVAKSDCL